MTALDLDIVRASRPSDYDLDVIVGGEWVASAKNFHHADEAGHEIWYRTVLDQPPADPHRARAEKLAQSLTAAGAPSHVVSGDGGRSFVQRSGDTDPPAIGEGPGENNPPPNNRATPLARTAIDMAIEQTMARNRICATCRGPHITWRCTQIHSILFAPSTCMGCGDVLDWTGPGLCQACREWSEPIAA